MIHLGFLLILQFWQLQKDQEHPFHPDSSVNEAIIRVKDIAAHQNLPNDLVFTPITGDIIDDEDSQDEPPNHISHLAAPATDHKSAILDGAYMGLHSQINPANTFVLVPFGQNTP